MQLASDSLEGGAGRHNAAELVELSPLGGIGAASKQLSRIVTGLARRFQSHDDFAGAGLRVVPKGNPLLLATEVVLPEPPPGQVRRNFKVETARVGQTCSGLVGWTDRVAASEIRQWQGEQPGTGGSILHLFPDLYPFLKRDLVKHRESVIALKPSPLLGISVLSGLSETLWNRQMACPAGLEPATPSLEGWCSIQLSYGQ